MNITQQIVHCRCPKNSISYLIKREPLKTGAPGYTYLFACSPQSVSLIDLICHYKFLAAEIKRSDIINLKHFNPIELDILQSGVYFIKLFRNCSIYLHMHTETEVPAKRTLQIIYGAKASRASG